MNISTTRSCFQSISCAMRALYNIDGPLSKSHEHFFLCKCKLGNNVALASVAMLVLLACYWFYCLIGYRYIVLSNSCLLDGAACHFVSSSWGKTIRFGPLFARIEWGIKVEHHIWRCQESCQKDGGTDEQGSIPNRKIHVMASWGEGGKERVTRDDAASKMSATWTDIFFNKVRRSNKMEENNEKKDERYNLLLEVQSERMEFRWAKVRKRIMLERERMELGWNWNLKRRKYFRPVQLEKERLRLSRLMEERRTMLQTLSSWMMKVKGHFWNKKKDINERKNKDVLFIRVWFIYEFLNFILRDRKSVV